MERAGEEHRADDDGRSCKDNESFTICLPLRICSNRMLWTCDLGWSRRVALEGGGNDGRGIPKSVLGSLAIVANGANRGAVYICDWDCNRSTLQFQSFMNTADISSILMYFGFLVFRK